MSASNSNSAVLKKNEICIDYNQTFEMVFDVLTPRPHFIIKFRPDINNNNPHKSLLDLSFLELNSLLKFVMNFHERLQEKNKNFVLSFHTGSWAKHATFHANLCIDLDLYLQFVEENNNFDLIEIKPTREWHINKTNLMSTKELYIANVKNAKQVAREKSEKFRKHELEIIRRLNSVDANNNEIKPIVKKKFTEFKRENLEVFYDIREPLIEFFNTDSKNTSGLKRYGDLLKAMIEYAQEQKMFDRNNGAHICLNINSDSNCFNGFIRTSGDLYHQINPSPGLFLSNFSKLNDYLIDT